MKNLKRIIAIGAAVALLAPLGAEAHVKENVPTSLTIKASDTRVDKGTRVTFTGKLKSDWKKCKANQKVRLYRNKKAVAKGKTNASGKYTISKKISKKGKYSVKYAGRQWGTHPHSHSCLPSQSKKIRIRVT